MSSIPTEQQLVEALTSAARAHHEYEKNYLNCVRDEQWSGWYSAYVLGRLGDFAKPAVLTKLLEEVTEKNDWGKKAAAHILSSSSR